MEFTAHSSRMVALIVSISDLQKPNRVDANVLFPAMHQPFIFFFGIIELTLSSLQGKKFSLHRENLDNRSLNPEIVPTPSPKQACLEWILHFEVSSTLHTRLFGAACP